MARNTTGTVDLNIVSLTGGQNDQNPPTSLPDDQCVLMRNVDIFESTLGERRGGSVPVDVAGSGLEDEDQIVHLGIHYPAQAHVSEAELIGIGATLSTSIAFAHRDDAGAWTVLTCPDSFDNTAPNVYDFQSKSLHGKWFLAGKSNVDRLHVHVDGNIRRTGLAAPTGVLTASDTGSGSYAGVRTFRVRVIEKSGTVILRRSEPSAELEFTPSGSGSGAIINLSGVTPPSEGETDWEIEASDGDGNFYVIQTQAVGTLTYTDSTQPATAYAEKPLSPDIGTYDLILSVKFLKADQDRLVMGGSWEDPEKGSRISWTPVWNDPGFGNDERLPANIDSFVDLDWMEGGDLTGISDPLNGAFYAFKWSRIYKVQRTGDATQAYQAFLLSSAYGALDGSIISGTDEYGRGCVYFLDPSIGPMRVGPSGVQYLRNIRGTWRTVNTNASNVVSHGLYYREKQQVIWWVATGEADLPNYGLKLQVSEVRSAADGTTRGWTVFDGRYAEAICSVAFPTQVQNPNNGALSLNFIPYVGLTAPSFIQKGDSSNTDDGVEFRAVIITKPYMVAGPLNKWGGMNGVLLAEPNRNTKISLEITLIRDFGVETFMVPTDFQPISDEVMVIKKLDNLAMSDATAIQIQFADPDTSRRSIVGSSLFIGPPVTP